MNTNTNIIIYKNELDLIFIEKSLDNIKLFNDSHNDSILDSIPICSDNDSDNDDSIYYYKSDNCYFCEVINYDNITNKMEIMNLNGDVINAYPLEKHYFKIGTKFIPILTEERESQDGIKYFDCIIRIIL